MNIFEKSEQAKLKEEYKTLLLDVWGKDGSMIDYCSKKAEVVIKTSNGYYLEVEKESIEKNFCFGYRLSHTDSEEYDNANSMVNVAKTDVDYFREKNLEPLQSTIKELEENDVYVINHYISQKNNLLKQFRIYKYWDSKDKGAELLSEEDKQLLIQGYKEELAKFEKRLNTYIKKYGTSKVHSWSYWVDA